MTGSEPGIPLSNGTRLAFRGMSKTKGETKRPPHYRVLSLRNFRGFKKAERIPLRPLTFLVGPNSAGKSSLFDALLLIAQSEGFTRLFVEPPSPRLTGDLVNLGTYEDAIYAHKTKLRMTIEVGFDLGRELAIKYGSDAVVATGPIVVRYDLRESRAGSGAVLSRLTIADARTGEQLVARWTYSRKPTLEVTLNDIKKKQTLDTRGRLWESFLWVRPLILKHTSKRKTKAQQAAWRRLGSFVEDFGFAVFASSCERVSSGRAGPERWYTRDATTMRDPRRVGPTLYDRVDPAMIQVLTPRRPRRAINAKKAQKASLSRILEELDIANWIEQSALSEYHSAIQVRDNKSGVVSHLIDVGYGTSQVIPVVAGCFSNNPGPLLVEQPEIHLHPKAQGVVAELLCRTSSQRQVIVETHAVHMINRARVMIVQGDLRSEDVMIIFVSRDKNGSHAHPIPILPDGEFGGDWPGGFFDERYQDTMKLLHLKSKNSS